MSRALVGNAADEAQVADGSRKEKSRRTQELSDLRVVLKTPEGQRVFWRLLEEAKAFQSVFHVEPSLTAYHAGRQDFGHYLIAELSEAIPGVVGDLMRAQRKES